MKPNQKKRVRWLKSSASLSQAINSGVEFAFLSDDGSQCSPFAFCKDFLHDAISGRVNKKNASIYGFKYSPKSPLQPSLNKIKLLLANASDIEFRTKIDKCVDFINQIESKLDVPHTTVRECSKPPLKYIRGGVWYFEGNKRWLNSPPMISLYALLLRIGFGHKLETSFQTTLDDIVNYKVEPYQKVDRGRLKEAMPGITRILNEGDENIFHKSMKENYPKGVGISAIHNNFGIIGFANGSTAAYVPYWHQSKK